MDVQSSWDHLRMSKVLGSSMDVHKVLCQPQNSYRQAELHTENAARGDWQNGIFQKSTCINKFILTFQKSSPPQMQP